MDKITINSINLFYDDFQALKNINLWHKILQLLLVLQAVESLRFLNL